MKKSNIIIDQYFIFICLEILAIMLFIMYSSNEVMLLNYGLVGILFVIIFISYFSGKILGILSSIAALLLYGSYMIYISTNIEKDIYIKDLIWIGIFPLTAMLISGFSERIDNIQKRNKQLENDMKNLVETDYNTGLETLKSFYINLDKEISKAISQEFDLTLMIIKLQFYEDIRAMLGVENTDNLLKKIGKLIGESVRLEDKVYKIGEDTFAVSLANKDSGSSKIIKERIKGKSSSIELREFDNKIKYEIELKVGIYQYNANVESTFDFKNKTEKQVEYDD